MAGIAVAGLTAQETTTWINPADNMAFLPASLPGFVTYGFYYDEWDIIVRSPAELSNYEGYNVYTAYGNYEMWALNPPVGGFINPFSTATVSTAMNIGTYYLGYAMPLLGFRVAAIGGFNPGAPTTPLNIAAAGPFAGSDIDDIIGSDAVSEWEETVQDETNSLATGDFDIIDYTENWLARYRQYTVNSTYNVGAGIDLGFIGAAVYANIVSSIRTLGGIYEYDYTHGSDTVNTTPAADKVTSRDVYTGLGENGAPTAYPNGGNPSVFGAVAELPLALDKLVLPITAAVEIGITPTDAPGSMWADIAEPVSVSIATTEVSTASAATDANSVSMVFGEAPGGDMLATDRSANKGSDVSLTTAQLRNLVTGGGGLTDPATFYAYDADNSSGGSFRTAIRGDVQPFLVQNENFTVKTKAGLGFSVDAGSATEAGTKSATLSYNDGDGAGVNDVFTYSSTVTATSTTTTTVLDAVLGGILQFVTSDGIVSVGSGFFWMPTFETETVTLKNPIVTTTTGSYTDGAGATGVPDAVFGDAITDIDNGVAQGSYRDTSTVSLAGNTVARTNSNTFTIPIAAKVKIPKVNLELYGGYDLTRVIETVQVMTPDQITTSDYSISNSGGTEVDDNGIDPLAATTVPAVQDDTEVTEGTTTQTDTGEWEGQMNWMLRWMPHASLTVDFYGAMIMNALDFDIFGATGSNVGVSGFNLSDFISSLGLSVTFSIK